MFRHRHRSSPFSEFINWTDYRWEPNTWQGATAGPRPWHPHARHRRGYSLVQVFLAGLAVVVVLLVVASYVSRRRRAS